MRKMYFSQVISIEFIKTRKHHLQVCHKEERAIFTSHLGGSLIFFMFINLLIYLLNSYLLFHFILFDHFNYLILINKSDILIDNIDQYGDTV